MADSPHRSAAQAQGMRRLRSFRRSQRLCIDCGAHLEIVFARCVRCAARKNVYRHKSAAWSHYLEWMRKYRLRQRRTKVLP